MYAGASERRLMRGSSELTYAWGPASALMMGASERGLGGASEFPYGGASERIAEAASAVPAAESIYPKGGVAIAPTAISRWSYMPTCHSSVTPKRSDGDGRTVALRGDHRDVPAALANVFEGLIADHVPLPLHGFAVGAAHLRC